MIDLTGRLCVVTGATSGIGRATAQALAAMGAAVVVHGRNAAAVDSVCRAIAGGTPGASVTAAVADFASLADVRRMARTLASQHERIDVLVNNAGAVTRARKTTVDGFEWQLGVNHLAPFLLTNLLLETLVRGGPARIVTVSSHTHRRASIDLDDLNRERGPYSALGAYGASKLANVLFTVELARRLCETDVTANCLHPGIVATDIFDNGGFAGRVIKALGRWLLASPGRGAATSVYLASSPEVAGVTGKYFDRCREARPSAAAADSALAGGLWEVSEKMTGLPHS